jgi:hypothetical protein
MRILIHVCCANCAIEPVSRLRGRGHDITGLWYNPNIHPRAEYARRREALALLQAAWGLEVVGDDAYGFAGYMCARAELAPGMPYCLASYRMRLGETARIAREAGSDAFTTTLLVSPYQRQDLIRMAGEEAALAHGVPFYFEDFRDGFREGREKGRALGLYSQNYCGCITSLAERDMRRARRGRALSEPVAA